MDQATRTNRWSRCRALCVVATLSASALVSLSASAGGERPEHSSIARIDSEGPSPSFLERRSAEANEPLWVSAEAATGPDGRVDWELLGESARKGFEGVAIQTPLSLRRASHHHSGVVWTEGPDGSRTYWYHYGPDGVADLPGGGRWTSLEDLVHHAEVIYLGTVTGVVEGFFGGGPGSLLTIRVDELLRPRGQEGAGDEVYLYYPDAKFSIGGLNFWKKLPSFPERPVIGDRILIADHRPAPDAAGKTVLPRVEGLFVESESRDGISLKGGIESASAGLQSLDGVADQIRSLLRPEERYWQQPTRPRTGPRDYPDPYQKRHKENAQWTK